MKIFYSKGITLVSLVVTIVLLIILAGVAVSNVIGNNSSVNRAKQAKITEEQESKKEVLEQALVKYNSGDYIGDGNLASFLIKELDISEYYESNKKNIAKITDQNGLESYIIHDFKGESAYLTSEDGLWKIQSFSNLGDLEKLQDGDTLH